MGTKTLPGFSSLLRPSPPQRALSRADKDRIILNLEARMKNNPQDQEAANRLIAILDHDKPEVQENCAYTNCQRALDTLFEGETSLENLIDIEIFSEQLSHWQQILADNGVSPPVVANQLFMGKIHSINNVNTRCEVYLNLFAKTGAIPKICHDCFKVQILPLNVLTLVQVFFVLRALKLQRDNSRKCMIEVRKDIPYPYKGYIYCETEEEASSCLAALYEQLERHKIKDVVCGISHGCSEYSQKHPDFKYSTEGTHRNFQRPEAWDKIEARYLVNANNAAPTMRTDLNRAGVTLRDMVGFNTWFQYADIIGDKSYQQFLSDPKHFKVKSFTKSIKDQAKMRRRELLDLRRRFEGDAQQ